MLYGGTKTKHKPQELKFSERKCEKKGEQVKTFWFDFKAKSEVLLYKVKDLLQQQKMA